VLLSVKIQNGGWIQDFNLKFSFFNFFYGYFLLKITLFLTIFWRRVKFRNCSSAPKLWLSSNLEKMVLISANMRITLHLHTSMSHFLIARRISKFIWNVWTSKYFHRWRLQPNSSKTESCVFHLSTHHANI
jgi:hypothetical protein